MQDLFFYLRVLAESSIWQFTPFASWAKWGDTLIIPRRFYCFGCGASTGLFGGTPRTALFLLIFPGAEPSLFIIDGPGESPVEFDPAFFPAGPGVIPCPALFLTIFFGIELVLSITDDPEGPPFE